MTLTMATMKNVVLPRLVLCIVTYLEKKTSSPHTKK